MRTSKHPRYPYLTHELATRIGAGAFEYEFGAVDGSDNPLTKSYFNLGHVSTIQL